MENVLLAVEDDDLYSGYNDYNLAFDTEELNNDVGFQQAVRTSHGRRPPMTAKFPGTAVGSRPLVSSLGKSDMMSLNICHVLVGLALVQDGSARPMTAIRAAGFTSTLTKGSTFDPLGQSRGPAPPLEAKNEDLPEEKIKVLEKRVNELIEESCMAHGNHSNQTLPVTVNETSAPLLAYDISNFIFDQWRHPAPQNVKCRLLMVFCLPCFVL
uniref:Uncharacterized protein n=1 Tax=Periophthalmus magnuspinnatus TaxID=409849 RepID=A0A3B4A7X3_9GOBI